MLEKFSQILQRLMTIESMSSLRNPFGNDAPFKVHVNFYIPVFEG
jgi:hypothetical protein